MHVEKVLFELPASHGLVRRHSAKQAIAPRTTVRRSKSRGALAAATLEYLCDLLGLLLLQRLLFLFQRIEIIICVLEECSLELC